LISLWWILRRRLKIIEVIIKPLKFPLKFEGSFSDVKYFVCREVKNMKRIIISAGIVLAVLIALGGITVSAQQIARVKNVDKHKGFVYIDEGKDAGFVMGATVCIYSLSGEQIACGRVRETRKSHHAMIMVNKEESHHIEDGMIAKLVVKKKE
jgi:hypothetical protein